MIRELSGRLAEKVRRPENGRRAILARRKSKSAACHVFDDRNRTDFPAFLLFGMIQSVGSAFRLCQRRAARAVTALLLL